MAMTIEELEDALIGRAFKVGDKVKLNASALSRTYVAEPGTRAVITGEAFFLPSGRLVQPLVWQFTGKSQPYHQKDGAYSVVDFELVSRGAVINA
ncbi:hypothetical protein [Mesorhizobium escarrei]|uniref:Uncharacterized protein n=1 Tax=Mesorhizobium escarrei TaxID=666018 RepID=A0ABM9DSD9_9HYPH|nr:hypothetical protein [Mesorhizobium escarrei]CAH2399606.1 hypothetical protein MES5069_230024 [Mesorhizobium escarrei]